MKLIAFLFLTIAAISTIYGQKKIIATELKNQMWAHYTIEGQRITEHEYSDAYFFLPEGSAFVKTKKPDFKWKMINLEGAEIRLPFVEFSPCAE